VVRFAVMTETGAEVSRTDEGHVAAEHADDLVDPPELSGATTPQ